MTNHTYPNTTTLDQIATAVTNVDLDTYKIINLGNATLDSDALNR